jgi:AraC-like DNA-binding protein
MADSEPALPRLYRPGPPLNEYVEYFGYWRSGVDAVRDRALPRGAATLIVDVGSPQRLDLYAADGATPLEVGAAFLSGPHATSYVSDIAPGTAVLAVHFRPGGAYPFCGVPLHELANVNVDLEAIWGADARRLHERLVDASSTAQRFAIVEQFLLSQARFSTARHPGVAVALAAFEASTELRVADTSRLVDLSPKRLIALFRNEIGLTPKAYARVRRFQSALGALHDEARGAEIAAEAGYFDQSHFVREFRAFAAMTPTQYLRSPVRMPSHVSADGQKYPIPAAMPTAR